MMEFTLSRVAMIVCGVVMLSAVVTPISGLYGGMEEERLGGTADSFVSMFDGFCGSEADILIIRGNDVLPNSSYQMEIDGYVLELSDGTTVCKRVLAHPVEGNVIINTSTDYRIHVDNGSLVFVSDRTVRQPF